MVRHCLTVLALTGLFVTLAPAQAPPPDGTVAGTGTSVLKRPPELLRMQLELTVKGKDLKEALSKLKERREAVRIQLATLGAAKESVQFGEPGIAASRTDPRRQMEMMVRDRVRKKPGKAQPEPVTLSTTLKADFPLKTTDPEELMLASHTLQEKIKAADLAGLKEAKALTPQEEEIAEELGGLDPEMMHPDMRNMPKPGEPMFLFVSKVSEEERTRAMAEAFQRAKADAAKLAQAAGMELGTLRQLHNASVYESEPEYPNPYGGYGYSMQRLRGSGQDSEEARNEAVGAQPGKVTLRLTVTAAFALQKAPK